MSGEDEFIWNDDSVQVDGVVCWFIGAILLTCFAIVSMVLSNVFHLTLNEGAALTIVLAVLPYLVGKFFYFVFLLNESSWAD